MGRPGNRGYVLSNCRIHTIGINTLLSSLVAVECLECLIEVAGVRWMVEEGSGADDGPPSRICFNPASNVCTYYNKASN